MPNVPSVITPFNPQICCIFLFLVYRRTRTWTTILFSDFRLRVSIAPSLSLYWACLGHSLSGRIAYCTLCICSAALCCVASSIGRRQQLPSIIDINQPVDRYCLASTPSLCAWPYYLVNHCHGNGRVFFFSHCCMITTHFFGCRFLVVDWAYLLCPHAHTGRPHG